MRHAKRINRQVLSALARSSSGLEAYTFSRRYGFLPSQLFSAISELEDKGYVSLDPDTWRLSLTDEGREFVLATLSYEKGRKTWREVPDEYCVPALPRNAVYIPRLSKLDKKFFR